MRLNQIARKLNVSTETIVNYLQKQHINIDNNPNTKLHKEQIAMLTAEFWESKGKEITPTTSLERLSPKNTPSIEEKTPPPAPPSASAASSRPAPSTTRPPKHKDVTKTTTIATANKKEETPKEPKKQPSLLKDISLEKKQQNSNIPTLGEIKMYEAKPDAKTPNKKIPPKHVQPPKRISKPSFHKKKKFHSPPSPATNTYYKKRKDKKKEHAQKAQFDVISITPFATAEEFAALIGVSTQEVIKSCHSLDIHIVPNQRLDPTVLSLLAEAFNRQIKLITVEQPTAAKEKDSATDLRQRIPVVVVMGHVDHGKTSFLDYIRKTKVRQAEVGGITQHIGAYKITVENEREITFIDTPGHKAFTAMRARGAKITDIAIIIIAADDGVMPQTKEAIKHAQLAGVRIIFAFNKIDKSSADVEKAKKQLSDIGILVEDWGGKYQSQEISAKTGKGIDALLEKVLLEADLLELKANPNKSASGTVIESTLEKGRGYITTVIVHEGTLKVGDIMLVGAYFGKVKAMYTTQGELIKSAFASTPVRILGVSDLTQAGTPFTVVSSEKEARNIAQQHRQALQAQKLRVQYVNPATLFKQKMQGEKKETLNLLIKGKTEGLTEALAYILSTLSTEKRKVYVVYKGVGPVHESDVMLATTTGAHIIAFQTTIDSQAKKAMQQEKIAINTFPVIYDAVNFVQETIKNQDKPLEEEVVIGKATVLKIFNIARIGTIAGCVVKEGSIKRNAQIRIMRGEKEIYKGPIKQLKREKEVIKEAKANSECGISTPNESHVEVGDIIECLTLKTTHNVES